MDLCEYAKFDATGLFELLRTRQVTRQEIVDLSFKAIDAVNPRLNAIVELYRQRGEASYLENLPDGPLKGVPILKKDLGFAEAGHLNEMGSMLSRGMVAEVTSTAYERLRDAGVVSLGRTTTPEFGLTGTTESRLSGISRNPWSLERTPGGSSGGSSAMVAAGAVPVATASDGGGSTRSPAAYCGLVGLKQTRGRIPAGPGRAEGNSGLSASFVVTRTVRDCALFLDVMHGPASGDPYGIAPPARSYVDEMAEPVEPLKIAYWDEAWAATDVSDASKKALENAMKCLEAQGHLVEKATPKYDVDAFIDATTVVACANLARDVDDIARKMQRRIDHETLQSTTFACYRYGKELSATALLVALQNFNTVNRAFGAFFEEYDILATPTNPKPAPVIEEYYRCDPSEAVSAEAWQRAVFENDSYLAAFNTTGQPAISLPLHETPEGLPVGVQFASRFGDEALLIRLAANLEEALPWGRRIPLVHVSKTG
jgi:amidase